MGAEEGFGPADGQPHRHHRIGRRGRGRRLRDHLLVPEPRAAPGHIRIRPRRRSCSISSWSWEWAAGVSNSRIWRDTPVTIYVATFGGSDVGQGRVHPEAGRLKGFQRRFQESIRWSPTANRSQRLQRFDSRLQEFRLATASARRSSPALPALAAARHPTPSRPCRRRAR